MAALRHMSDPACSLSRADVTAQSFDHVDEEPEGPEAARLPANVAAAAGLPLLSLLFGRYVETFDAQFNLISISYTGEPAQDICQLLQ